MTDREEIEMHALAVMLEQLTRGSGWEASRYGAIGGVMDQLAEYCQPAAPSMTTTTTSNSTVAVTLNLWTPELAVASRLRERMRIQQLDDPADPDYPKRTRQLLQQLDEYPEKTPCLVVSIADIETLLAAHGSRASSETQNEK